MEEKFNDLGVDAIVGSDLMYKMSLSEDEIALPQAFEKMKDIIDFLKTVPPEERNNIISRVTAGKNIDKLDHMWQYSQISRKVAEKRQELQLLEDELSYYER